MTAARDTPTPAGLTPEQARAYHERAGILEYDGHLPRQMAEAVALAGVRRVFVHARAWPKDCRTVARLEAKKQQGVVLMPNAGNKPLVGLIALLY